MLALAACAEERVLSEPCDGCVVSLHERGILDPDSEVSYIMRTKRVFIQLKEELGTNPRFFYYFEK